MFSQFLLKNNYFFIKMIELLENINVDGFIAVIPSVSVGNVGQLASDLLISSLNMSKLGYVWHSCVLPLSGADPYERSNLSATGCELYISLSLKLIVFQIRSAVIKTRYFVDELCAWLKSKNLKLVVILTGSSAHERKDNQLYATPLRFVFCPKTYAEESENAKTRNWIELEIQRRANESCDNESLKYIPGSGLAVKLFNKCIKREIHCCILLNFCSDGDNIPDAIKLVDYFNEWFQVKERLKLQKWIFPPSWKLLFGSQFPIEIFN